VEANSVEEYLATCDQNQVTPQAAIVRGLPGHQVNVRHRCLGDQDAHALSTALCVCITYACQAHALIQSLYCVDSSFVPLF